MIELRSGLVENRRERAAAIVGDVRAAVVRLDHPTVVFGIDPDIVVVTVWRRDFGEGAAAICALPEREVVDVNGVGIDWIGRDMGVVPGTREQVLVVRDFFPGGAEVI